MNIHEALTFGTNELNKSKTSEARASAEVLLCDVLNLSRTEILTHGEKELTLSDLKKYRKHLKKRQNHEPVWQIIGKVDFWGMQYTVDKNVLVPRPETEILVKEVLEHARTQKRALKVLDLGTGAGTIIIALASELHNCSFFASDVSVKALRIARLNTNNLLKKKPIKFKNGDLFNPWRSEKFDIIVANLPYIPHEDMASLAFDVYHYEPRVALDGGTGGLEIYERFFKELPSYLNKEGAVFCEIGVRQGGEFKKVVEKYLPKTKVEILGDLAGIDRVAIIKA